MESKFNHDKEEFKTQLDTISKKVAHNEEKIDVIDRQKEQLRTDIHQLTHTTSSNRSLTEQKIQFVQDKTTEKFDEISNRISKIENNEIQFEKKFEMIMNDNTEISFVAKRGDRNAEESLNELKTLKKIFKRLKKEIVDSIEKIKSLTYLHTGETMSLNKKVYDYLNNEYKLKISLLMNENLYEILNDPKHKRNIAKLENEKIIGLDESLLSPDIKEMLSEAKNRSQIILDTPIPPSPRPTQKYINQLMPASSMTSSKSSMSQVADRSHQATNRLHVPNGTRAYEEEEYTLKTEESEIDTKNMDMKESFAIRNQSPTRTFHGSFDIPDDLTSKLNENSGLNRERFDSFMPDNYHKKSDSESNSSLKDRYYMESQIDYMPYIEEAKNESRSMIYEIRNQFLELKNELIHLHEEDILGIKLKIDDYENDTNLKLLDITSREKKFTEDSSNKLKELQLLVTQTTQEVTSALGQRKRDLSDISSDIKTINSKFENVSKNYPNIEEKFESLKKVLELLVEYSKICISLQYQDEIDRDSISLMAYKENNNKLRPPSRSVSRAANSRPVVAIDKQCQSCAGQSSIVMNAFKMACLAYTPSNVNIGTSNFTRKELIDIQKKIIDGIWEKNSNEFSMTSFIDENRNIRSKTSSTFRRWRPSSVPAQDLIIHTPAFDLNHTESELPGLTKKNRKNNL